MLQAFLETDLFHVGLSPVTAKIVRVRRLALRIQVQNTHDIPAMQALITDRELRNGFTLDIIFQKIQ
jgi:hypothetical protein